MNFEVPKNFELVTDVDYVIKTGDKFLTQRTSSKGFVTYSGWRSVSSSVGHTVSDKSIVSKNTFKFFARSTVKSSPVEDTAFSKLKEMFDSMDGVVVKQKKAIKKNLEKQDTLNWPEPPDGYVFEDNLNYILKRGDKFIADKYGLKNGSWNTINSFAGSTPEKLKRLHYYDVFAVAIKGDVPMVPRFKTNKPYPFGW